ncbi:MAG TPA: quinoprotein dehydrogenase-associated SoxYZ-like carrier [Burkholderiales bacterium]|nr:quinoprotein dehydrogenase-associated SoxYZ-like carrier [Burkholderiales bacterium]
MSSWAQRIAAASVAALLVWSFSLVTGGSAHAADGPPDPETIPVWLQMRSHLFGDRPLIRDRGQVVSLVAPARAQDAATVPISISTHVDQTPQRYISKVYLLIDANPSPLGGVLTFTPLSGRADIETRVRVEDYTWMRVVAEMNDGTLYLDQQYVKAAGGCSAPYGTAPDFDAFTPRAKLKVDESVLARTPVLAQLMIQHPNSSGLAKDQVTHLFIPPYFVRRIDVTYDDALVMSAEIDFTISENPNFRFYFTADKRGELKAVVVDTKDRRVEQSVRVEPVE